MAKRQAAVEFNIEEIRAGDAINLIPDPGFDLPDLEMRGNFNRLGRLPDKEDTRLTRVAIFPEI